MADAARDEAQKKGDDLYNEIQSLKSSMEQEIYKAKLEAIKLAQLKSELGEFVAEMSDADLMSEDKVEIARLKKQLSVEKASKVVADVKPELVLANKTSTVKVIDKAAVAGELVRKAAYGL